MLIGNLPGEAGTPVVADEVKAPVSVAESRHDIEYVADQKIDPVTAMIARVGSCIDSVAALIWCNCEEPSPRQREHLRVPQIS